MNNSTVYTEWIKHISGASTTQIGRPKTFNIWAIQHNWEIKFNGTAGDNFKARLQAPGGSGDWYTLDTYSTTSPESFLRHVNSQPHTVTRVRIDTFANGSTIDIYTRHGGR